MIVDSTYPTHAVTLRTMAATTVAFSGSAARLKLTLHRIDPYRTNYLSHRHAYSRSTSTFCSVVSIYVYLCHNP